MSNSTLEVINLVPVAKVCRKCGLTFFSSRCRACARVGEAAYRKNNSEKIKAARDQRCKPNPSPEQKAANKKREYQYSAKWKAANKDKVNATRRAYYRANVDAMKVKARGRRVASPEKVKAEKNSWRERNPNAARLYKQNRKALQTANGGTLSKNLAEKLITLQKGLCPCCRQPLGKNYHLDHVMPLALGGSNVDSNIQLLRAGCNLSKHAIHPVDFMQSRGFLL